MQKPKINDLPELVKNGVLSKKQGAHAIWEHVYLNPQMYGLAGFSKDELSEFLLTLESFFPLLFDKFIPGIVQFKTFIFGFVSNYKGSFKRKKARRAAEHRGMYKLLQTKCEEDEEHYLVSDSEIIPKIEPNPYAQCSISDIVKKRSRTPEGRQKRIAHLDILMLILKSCQYVDDETLALASHFLGIKKETLQIEIQTLKTIMQNRRSRRETMIAKRNNAFFYHRKYSNELTRLDENTPRFQDTLKRYHFQTQSWKKKNKLLEHRFKNEPTNSEIALIIGMNARMVTFYIQHAKRQENTEKLTKLVKKVRDEIENSSESKYTVP